MAMWCNKGPGPPWKLKPPKWPDDGDYLIGE